MVQHFLPAIFNSLSNSLSSRATALGDYSVTYIANHLGPQFLGEDADVVKMREEIENRIRKLNEKIQEVKNSDQSFTPMTEDEIQAKYNQLVGNMMASADFTENNEKLYRQFEAATRYIEANVYNWTTVNDQELQAMIDEMPDTVYHGGFLSKGVENSTAQVLRNKNYSQDKLAAAGISYDRFSSMVEGAFQYITDQKGQSSYKSYPGMNEMISQMQAAGIDTSSLTKLFDNRQSVCAGRNTRAQNATANLREWLLSDYSKSAIFYESNELQKMRDSLQDDPMFKLKELAKKDHRLVYAIAWCILLFQLFALIFLYYKRVFVVLVLVCLYPIVTSLYILDKMGDGKAQSLMNWFKEFFANCVIQFFHAVIYVTLINLGVDICKQDPAQNWFFLLLCVSFLFPAEQMLRGMVGLESTTIGGLKTNIVGGTIAAITVARTGFNVGKAAVNKSIAAGKFIKDFEKGRKSAGMGRLDYAKIKIHEERKRREEERRKQEAEERKKKKKHNDSRDQARRNRIEQEQKAAQLDKSERSTKENLYVARGNIRKATNKVKGKINGLKSSISNSKVGQFAGKSFKVAKDVYNTSKKVARGYGKVVGATAGAVLAMDSLGNNGIGAGLSTAGMYANSLVPNQNLNLPNGGGSSGKAGPYASTGAASMLRKRLGAGASSYSSSGSPSGPAPSVGPAPSSGPRPSGGPAPSLGPRPSGGPMPSSGPRPSGGPMPSEIPESSSISGSIPSPEGAGGAKPKVSIGDSGSTGKIDEKTKIDIEAHHKGESETGLPPTFDDSDD